MGAESTPTVNNLPFRAADFATLAEALDYAARGQTGANFYTGRGELYASLPYATLRSEARSKGVDLMVANDVSRPDAGFEADSNAVTLIDAHGAVEVPLVSKDEVADRILDRALALRCGRRQGAARQRRKAAPGARASR